MTKKRLLLLALLIAVVAAALQKTKTKADRSSQWHGLTEDEARAKLDAKLPTKIPAEKRTMISDKVVAKMRDRGVITEDAADTSDVVDDADQFADH